MIPKVPIVWQLCYHSARPAHDAARQRIKLANYSSSWQSREQIRETQDKLKRRRETVLIFNDGWLVIQKMAASSSRPSYGSSSNEDSVLTAEDRDRLCKDVRNLQLMIDVSTDHLVKMRTQMTSTLGNIQLMPISIEEHVPKKHPFLQSLQNKKYEL